MSCSFNENRSIESSNTGPHYSYFTALSSGLLIVITSTVLAIIFINYNPITDPLLFKAMGGYFIAIPLTILDTAGGLGFFLSLNFMLAHVIACKKPHRQASTEIVEQPQAILEVSNPVVIEESPNMLPISPKINIEDVEEFVVEESAQENIETTETPSTDLTQQTPLPGIEINGSAPEVKEDADESPIQEEQLRANICELEKALALLEAKREAIDPYGAQERNKDPEALRVANEIYTLRVEKYQLEAELETDEVKKLKKAIKVIREKKNILLNQSGQDLDVSTQLRDYVREIQTHLEAKKVIKEQKLKEKFDTAEENSLSKAEAGIAYFNFLSDKNHDKLDLLDNGDPARTILKMQNEDYSDKINAYHCLKYELLIQELEQSIKDTEEELTKIELRLQIINYRLNSVLHLITPKSHPLDYQKARTDFRDRYLLERAQLTLKRYDAKGDLCAKLLETEEDPLTKTHYELSIRRNALAKIEFWKRTKCLKPDKKALEDQANLLRKEKASLETTFAGLYLDPLIPTASNLMIALLGLHWKVYDKNNNWFEKNSKGYTKFDPDTIKKTVESIFSELMNDPDCLAAIGMSPAADLAAIDPLNVDTWETALADYTRKMLFVPLRMLFDNTLSLESAASAMQKEVFAESTQVEGEKEAEVEVTKKLSDRLIKDLDDNRPAELKDADRKELENTLLAITELSLNILGCRHTWKSAAILGVLSLKINILSLFKKLGEIFNASNDKKENAEQEAEKKKLQKAAAKKKKEEEAAMSKEELAAAAEKQKKEQNKPIYGLLDSLFHNIKWPLFDLLVGTGNTSKELRAITIGLMQEGGTLDQLSHDFLQRFKKPEENISESKPIEMRDEIVAFLKALTENINTLTNEYK